MNAATVSFRMLPPRPPEPQWENCPAELTTLPIFSPWRFEWDVDDERTGRQRKTKIFYEPEGRRARSNDPRTWVSFEIAQCSYFAEHPNGGRPYDGVGICLNSSLGITGFDGDKDKATGELDPRALSIINRLDTYSEYSPSGGLRAFCYATLPPKDRRSGLLELYCSERFLTLTGNRLPGAPHTINSRQAIVSDIHGEIFAERIAQRQRHAHRPSAVPVDASDEDLIALACKASERFASLYHGGWEGDDQSSQDMWLCSRLSFWTGCDGDRMDRIFRHSSLYRSKWDRVGAATIAKAVAECREIYHPRQRPPLKFKRRNRSAHTPGLAGEYQEAEDEVANG